MRGFETARLGSPDSGAPNGLIELLPVRLVFRSRSGRGPETRGGSEPAQVLYEAGSYSLDLSLSRERGPRMVLVGQIADHSAPQARRKPLPVTLESDSGRAAEDCCNAFGEFCLRYRGEEPVRLRVPVDERRAIEVPLPTAGPRLQPHGVSGRGSAETEQTTYETKEDA